MPTIDELLALENRAIDVTGRILTGGELRVYMPREIEKNRLGIINNSDVADYKDFASEAMELRSKARQMDKTENPIASDEMYCELSRRVEDLNARFSERFLQTGIIHRWVLASIDEIRRRPFNY